MVVQFIAWVVILGKVEIRSLSEEEREKHIYNIEEKTREVT